MENKQLDVYADKLPELLAVQDAVLDFKEHESKDEKGFTLIELAAGIALVLSIALFIVALYAGVHFIHKFW